jgi:hypothetical protein
MLRNSPQPHTLVTHFVADVGAVETVSENGRIGQFKLHQDVLFNSAQMLEKLLSQKSPTLELLLPSEQQ